MFHEYLQPIETAVPHLLPAEIIDNLTAGVPLRSNTDFRGQVAPFSYGEDFISAVAGYILHHPALYANPSFRKNIELFMQHFRLPQQLPVLSDHPIETDVVPLHRRGYADPRVLRDTQIPRDDDVLGHTVGRYFMHGRFNGWPYPAILETLALARRDFPKYSVWLGIDHDRLSLGKGQSVFMDQQFRASLFLATGLVDRVVLLDSPEDPEDSDHYWGDLYAHDGDLHPDVVVIPSDALAERKYAQTSTRSIVLDPFQQLDRSILPAYHQTDLKDGTYPLDRLERDWAYLRGLGRCLAPSPRMLNGELVPSQPALF